MIALRSSSDMSSFDGRGAFCDAMSCSMDCISTKGCPSNPPSVKGDSDFYFVEADDPETAVRRIVELVKTRIPKRFGLNPIRDIQVLCPMNRGGVGARSLNVELQT